MLFIWSVSPESQQPNTDPLLLLSFSSGPNCAVAVIFLFLFCFQSSFCTSCFISHWPDRRQECEYYLLYLLAHLLLIVIFFSCMLDLPCFFLSYCQPSLFPPFPHFHPLLPSFHLFSLCCPLRLLPVFSFMVIFHVFSLFYS